MATAHSYSCQRIWLTPWDWPSPGGLTFDEAVAMAQHWVASMPTNDTVTARVFNEDLIDVDTDGLTFEEREEVFYAIESARRVALESRQAA